MHKSGSFKFLAIRLFVADFVFLIHRTLCKPLSFQLGMYKRKVLIIVAVVLWVAFRIIKLIRVGKSLGAFFSKACFMKRALDSLVIID